MTPTPLKSVLVTGTGWAQPSVSSAARRIGSTLAETGLGLVTGNSTGVEKWVARAFCKEREARGEPVAGAFTQLSLGAARFFRRGGVPLPGYHAPAECRVHLSDIEAWKRESVARSHAAVIVGGGRGTLELARRFIERGRPVLPLPFKGRLTGNSDFAFQDILRTWESNPVPGLSKTQFLRLAEPWVSGTGPLANLLSGTLAEEPDVFISYRRSDAPAAAGRLAHDLAEHFGQRRVFLDIDGIAPSRAWELSIEDGLRSCKAGVVVIGRHWLSTESVGGRPRLFSDDDPVRGEVTRLFELKTAVFPVLVEGARLPEAAELPDGLRPLLRFQATSIDNAGWIVTMERLIREMEKVIRDDLARSPTLQGQAGTQRW